jgi:hypothetical protein
MFFKRSNDVHSILDKAYDRVSINQVKPNLSKYYFRYTDSNFIIIRRLLVFVSNFIMALDLIFYSMLKKNVVAREFSNVAMLLLIPITFLFRKRIFFNINHNLKLIQKEFPLSIKALCLLGYQFIFFDGSGVLEYIPKKYRNQFHTPLFPVLDPDGICENVNKSFQGKELKVGIVGDFRSEKGEIVQILSVINKIASINGVFVNVGARSQHVFRGFEMDKKVRVANTTSESSYYSFIQDVDVLIIFATSVSYFSRHSGTIMDAVSHGVKVIAPNYPVFKSQITHPCEVGYLYNDINDIYNLICNHKNEMLINSVCFSKYTEMRKTIAIEPT